MVNQDLLEACEELLVAVDRDTEMPPWTYQQIYHGVCCSYCWNCAGDIESIDHEGDCPVYKAKVAIAKATKGRT